ncbi:protein LATERAL BRANCHING OXIDOREDUCTASE 1-like isoform X1 [Primulina tabacum]|uniref:protein LATERAL BRANCHING OXIDOREDUCTASE 1-like isoform X1 n=1 Tax=Primulina tabacum TaxID=48773 RepID=UPI003F5A5933
MNGEISSFSTAAIMENTGKLNHHESKFTDQNGIQQTILVPVVQDLARLKSLPRQFIQRRATKNATSTFTPAVIDMAGLRDGPDSSSRAAELQKLGREARDWGLFLIGNHGLVLSDVEQSVRGFFELPFEEKKRSVGTYMSVDNLGYGRSFVKSEDQVLDWIDRLAMKVAPKAATDGLAVWPNKPPNFRHCNIVNCRWAMEKYADGARKILDELLQALAEALSVDKRAFSQYFDQETTEINVRINYYPPSPDPTSTLGITAHSDASALTLLTQFESSNCLQIFKDDQWFTVHWPCNTLLVTVGDLMEIMSDGILKSPWHRAATQSEVDRFSVALFYTPPPGVEIVPVQDGMHARGGYKKVVVKEYIENSYRVNPAPCKRAIMFAKEANNNPV